MKTEHRATGAVPRTAWALAALGAGLAFGILVHGSKNPWMVRLVGIVGAVGQLWVAALRMTVLPLVVSLTLLAIVGTRRDGSVGALGLRSLLLFTVMLTAAGLLTFAVTAPVVSLYPVDAETSTSLRAGASSPAPAPAPEAAHAEPASLRSWLSALIPTNVFQAAANGEILPILLFTVFFGLAVNRLGPEQREPLRRIFQALADAMMVLIGWILKVLPIGVFALCADFAFRAGASVTGVLAVYVALVSGMLLVVTALLYPATAILGRASLSRFARAVAPAQVVGASTRSSLASLPALVEGGRKHLDLPPSATGFVLPLSVATFKLNRTISSPIRLLFLAHVFQLHLGMPQLAAFLLTEIILSFSTAGIPSVGAIRSLPAYLAAGIPIEGVLILNAVDTIPDIFKTLVNVTADMSVAAILSRRERAGVAPGHSAVGIG